MELTLSRQTIQDTQVRVMCDNQPSHSFDLRPLLLKNEKDEEELLNDPVNYGKALYAALFPLKTLAQRALVNTPPERILLITTDNDLDAVPWEYVYGPDGFLILECHFVRGLPADQRIAPPTLDNSLHIVAVPSNPLSHEINPLNIDGEWMQLKEIIQELPYTITLERTRPPTLERLRHFVANQQHRVVHFMGHGGQDEKEGAILFFEQDNGDLDTVSAKQFVLRVRGAVFLVMLNACVSATPGATLFSNLAFALVRHKVPYTLGMRFSIPDKDARALSRAFYNDLARGSSIEEALLQARLTLATSSPSWVIGVPVLYTALKTPAAGFTSIEGAPTVKEYQPDIEVTALPRAEGAFQGRIDELKQLGDLLTGDRRPRLVTIHGSGGQGKTALAREAVERFAYAWPGGVWATTLENLLGREVFVNDLARFLCIAIQEINDPAEIERQVLKQLTQHRTLIVLDNAETLIEAVRAGNGGVTQLSQLIQQLAGPTVSLLVTSREHLGWSGEIAQEIGGLSSEEGANLFRQSAPQRANEVEMALVKELSQKLKGHPLSLRLLGGAFNASSISLQTFIKDYDAQLLKAENKYVGEEHRHRTLYACIDTSVRYLDAELADLFSKLWLFHAPFLAETAVAIFDPQHEDTEENPSPIRNGLYILWQRGLVTRETLITYDRQIEFYHLLPTTRPYIEQYLAQPEEREVLLAAFGFAYLRLTESLSNTMNSSSTSIIIAQHTREDLERGAAYVTGIAQGYYLLHLGWILSWLGNPRYGLKLLERVLEIAQGQDQLLEVQARNMMALMYQTTSQLQQALDIQEQALSIASKMKNQADEAALLSNRARAHNLMGQPRKALAQYEEALLIWRKIGNRNGEAATLNSMADVYRAIGQIQRAFELSKEALFIMREVGDRAGEAIVLNSLGRLYSDTGKLQQALALFQEALPIRREMGDRDGEAATLMNIALAYDDMGQPQRALELYEVVLPIYREVGNRASEAMTLSNMGLVYAGMGQLERALELYEQALSIRREVGDQRGQAATLSNIAATYRTMGQLQRALEVCGEVLTIAREVEDRAKEAYIINIIADVYQDMGQLQQALELYKQALPIRREVGDRPGEAATLNNISILFWFTGQLKQALDMSKAVLSIWQELGNRAREASVLNNMARLYQASQQPREALHHYEEALSIRRDIGDKAGEATTLYYLATLLYQQLKRPQEAIDCLERAIIVLMTAGLTRDKAGNRIEDLQRELQILGTGSVTRGGTQTRNTPNAKPKIGKKRIKQKKHSRGRK